MKFQQGWGGYGTIASTADLPNGPGAPRGSNRRCSRAPASGGIRCLPSPRCSLPLRPHLPRPTSPPGRRSGPSSCGCACAGESRNALHVREKSAPHVDVRPQQPKSRERESHAARPGGGVGQERLYGTSFVLSASSSFGRWILSLSPMYFGLPMEKRASHRPIEAGSRRKSTPPTRKRKKKYSATKKMNKKKVRGVPLPPVLSVSASVSLACRALPAGARQTCPRRTLAW